MISFSLMLTWLVVIGISFFMVLRFSIVDLLLAKFVAWDTNRLAKQKEGNEILWEIKKELFGNMTNIIENIGGYVLEIGAGSGANLAYYPENTKLITIDLNDHFQPYLQKNLECNKQVTLEKYLTGNAEDMKLLADNSCSCVVSTFTLCCVDQEKVLKEVMRVLKPGGQFFFIEHIIEKPGWIRLYQQMMQPIWASLRGNCHLACNTDYVITKFGFDDLYCTTVYRTVPRIYILAILMRKTIVGYGKKPIITQGKIV